MDSFDFILFIVIPIFAVIIGTLLFTVMKDADKAIAKYEKETGKKIKVNNIKLNKDIEEKINIVENFLNKPLENRTKKKKEKIIKKTKKVKTKKS